MTTSQDHLLKIDAKDPNLQAQQEHLEHLSRGLGIEQYQKHISAAVKSGRESATSYGQSLMHNYISYVAEGIMRIKETKGKSGRNTLALKYFEAIEPEALAFLSLRCVLDNITKKDSLANVASKIGRTIELEIQTRVLKESRNEAYVQAKKKLKKATSQRHRRALVGTIYNRLEIAKTGIDHETCIKIGVKLIDIIINSTGLVEIRREIKGKRQQNFVVPTQELSKWIEDKNAHCELLSPVYLPCVIPPKDWTSPKKGGYHSKFHKGVQLVKTKGETERYRRLLGNTEMPKVYQAINTLQKTQWKINQDVYNVMNECYTLGIDMGDALVPFEDTNELECPACGSLVPLSKTNNRNLSSNHECFNIKDEEGKDTPLTKDWKRKARAIHEGNVAKRSKRLAVSKVLWVADLLKDFSSIYFPYHMDYRGRVYVVPNHLNPQGADYAKGLLTFSRGKAIEDPIAGSWLAIQGANTYGNDKVSFEERVSFIGGLEEEIRATVADPIGNKGFWTEADKPWQFLAFCFEWVGYLDAERKGETFVSHLPIAMDGSCSGIQHFSAMLRDEEGGAAVNLLPSERPQDIYQVVCDKVKKRFALDAKGWLEGNFGDVDDEPIRHNPNPYAEALLKLPLDRKLTKHQVMTVPYGLTPRSCTEYTAEYLKELNKKPEINFTWTDEEHWKVCQYASGVIWKSIQSTVVGAREAMKWLQEMVKVTVGTKDVPIVWNTPMGLPVMQSYRNYKYKQTDIYSEAGRFQAHTRTPKGEGVKLSRMKTGVAPNFVHSMDASHLVLCICLANDENALEDFAVIHDSFGTHAASSDALAYALRKSFVEMYSENNVLEQFKQDMETIVDGEFTEDVPELPRVKKMDLTQVIESKYCFA